MKNEETVVTVLVPVYNHGKYIKECLNSIMAQKTNFKYEVFIADDCSNDNSKIILKGIEKTYPDNFHFIYRNENYGMVDNIKELKKMVNSRYFILLEGDDYWVCEDKLQRQVDYLDMMNDCIAVAHNTFVVDKNSNIIDYKYPECKNEYYTWLDYERFLLPGQTTTIMMRSSILALEKHYAVLDKNFDFPLDRKIAFILNCTGRIFCIQEKMSAYRLVKDEGSSYTAIHINDNKNEFYKRQLQFYKNNYLYTLSEKKSLKSISATRRTYFFLLFKNCFQYKTIRKKIFYDELKIEKKYYIRILCYIASRVVHRGITVLLKI